MELRVNDYVRTKYYGISKILNINNETTSNYCSIKLDRIDDFGSLGVYVSRDNIIKSSPNIIDLIEVGDYVNGCKIIELATNIEGKVLYLETDITEFDNVYACGNINIYEKDIRTIVTKEQFESIKYNLENN